MTRKDYKLIAEVLKRAYQSKLETEDETGQIEEEDPCCVIFAVAVSLANQFGAENPRFDRNKFLNECRGK